MCDSTIKDIHGTTDIDNLARNLCCQRNFHEIYQVMEKCNYYQLVQLRTQLREYSTTGYLHNEIEHKFETMLQQIRDKVK